MSKSSPGIVLVSKYVSGNSSKFGKYIDYINREEAVRSKHFKVFNINKLDGYNNYMENPEKSKEYMIVCTGFFEGEYSDDRTHFIKDKEFINLIQQLEKENYSLLHHSEEFYYEDVKR